MTESAAMLKTISRLLVLLLVVVQSFLVIQDSAELDLHIDDELQSAHHAEQQTPLSSLANQKVQISFDDTQKSQLDPDFCEDTEQECDNCHHCHGSHMSLLTVLNETLFAPVKTALFSSNSLLFSDNRNDIYRPPSA